MANILVVDDSASMKKMVTFTLKGAGHSVIEASDGSEALTIAQRQSVDLVLSDVNMPNMNGIELCEKLRQIPSYKFTPILMLTTESAGDKKLQGKGAGATGWIVKPFNPDQLVSTVSKVLDR
jgi:two-component system chemotaxis response regulator CheY